jgi:simple sugar transport system ATP-binding protein
MTFGPAGAGLAARPVRRANCLGARLSRSTTADRCGARLSLHVAAGEIVGIAGVSGNGQRNWSRYLPASVTESGILWWAALRRTAPRCALGVFLLAEEPLLELRRSLSVAKTLRCATDAPPSRAGVCRSPRSSGELAPDRALRHSLRAGARVDTLSSGNVQRTVLARNFRGCAADRAEPCLGSTFPRRARSVRAY